VVRRGKLQFDVSADSYPTWASAERRNQLLMSVLSCNMCVYVCKLNKKLSYRRDSARCV